MNYLRNLQYAFLFTCVFLSGCNKDLKSSSPAEAEEIQTLKEISLSQNRSRVQLQNNSLYVDGEKVPQLFGAELQYFRLRGGQAMNIDPRKVEDLWRKALTKMKEAGMNAICFYIPWDFHEYAEGKFDFDGTADEDHDGRADYPARNLKLFFKMVTEEFKFKYVMARPGPYINAEWGFLGFGAVPPWFHNKYPEAHMTSSLGKKAKLYDYNSPELLKHTKSWFRAVYNEVLKDYIGPGKPIFALQVDNETNYQWASIYSVDYSERNQELFRKYLVAKYHSLHNLNQAYGTQYARWQQVAAPKAEGTIVAAKHDWHEYSDETIYKYLQKIQKIWVDLGVTQKDVLFTLAESYNAAPDGLIPNLRQRNDATTGMQTVNLYPKTAEPKPEVLPFSPLFNNPFKADHDVRLADAANDAYFVGKQKNEWVLGPEIQGGWWRGCTVQPEARMQTYLTTLGHGMKALFVYYFNEGDNWYADWERKEVRKIFDVFRAKSPYKDIPQDTLFSYALDRPQLVNQFWADVSNSYRQNVFYYREDDLNWAQWTLLRSENELHDLYFDAPLDKDANPRPHFDILANVGNKIVKPYGEWLGSAVELADNVVILKDSLDNAPQNVPDLDRVLVNADWSAGLYAYLLHAGYNAAFSAEKIEVNNAKVVVRYDYARQLPAADVLKLRNYVSSGGTLINFLEDTLAKKLSLGAAKVSALSSAERQASLQSADGHVIETNARLKPQYARAYAGLPNGCSAILKWGEKVVAYSCTYGQGKFIQISASLHDVYNANEYYLADSLGARTAFLKRLLAVSLKNKIEVRSNVSKVVAFARTNKNKYWVTLKSGEKIATTSKLKLSGLTLSHANYVVRDVLAGTAQNVTRAQLQAEGVRVDLPTYGAKVLFIEEGPR